MRVNASFADSINPGVFALDSKPYGSSYEDWTIKFWQWLLSISSDRNPITDTTGELCGENQNSTLPVFFLAFSGGGSAIRTCDVPAAKAILVPINVVECSFFDITCSKTEEELHTCAEEDESSNPGLFLSVDENSVAQNQSIELSSQGNTQSDIAKTLHVGEATVSRDISSLKHQAKLNLKTHINDKLPEEYQNCMVGINQVLKICLEIVNKSRNVNYNDNNAQTVTVTDNKTVLQALALINDCNKYKMDLTTNGVVITDAIKFVQTNKEKLSVSTKEEDKDYKKANFERVFY